MDDPRLSRSWSRSRPRRHFPSARSLGAVLGLALLAGAARAEEPPAASAETTPAARSAPTKTSPTRTSPTKGSALPSDAGAPLDLGALRDKLTLVTDGRQHFIAFGPDSDALYYGDGKVFWLQRVSSFGSSGTAYFSKGFWEPRARNPSDATFTLRDGAYTVECSTRLTALRPLSAEEQKPLVERAKFFAPRWKHKAYALMRDTTGRYYYVDQPRDAEQSQRFRLFVGVKGKGNMKPQKLVNVVSDSAGDVFATPNGALRLVLDQADASWDAGAQTGRKSTALIVLPLEASQPLIYTDLGVYAGERLGTPCDDL